MSELPAGVGKLRVGVLEARNVLSARHKFGRKGSRTQVRLVMGKKHARTEFTHGAQNPVFQEHFIFDQLPPVWELQVELRDRVASGPSSSLFKGMFIIQAADVPPGQLITKWYTLKTRTSKDKYVQGEILLQLIYFPDGIETGFDIPAVKLTHSDLIEEGDLTATYNSESESGSDSDSEHAPTGATHSATAAATASTEAAVCVPCSASPSSPSAPSHFSAPSRSSVEPARSLALPRSRGTVSPPLSAASSGDESYVPDDPTLDPRLVALAQSRSAVPPAEPSYAASGHRSPGSVKRHSTVSRIKRRVLTNMPAGSRTFQRRNRAFQRLFDLPPTEKLLIEFAASYIKGVNPIMLHGRMYISENLVCFYSNLFGVRTIVSINTAEIVDVVRKCGNIFPSAVLIKTHGEDYFFASFNQTTCEIYRIVYKVWKHEDISAEIAELLQRERANASGQLSGGGASGDQAVPLDDEDDESYLSSGTYAEDTGFLKAANEDLEELVTAEFPCSVVTFFTKFFSDDAQAFVEQYHKQRDDSDLDVGKWTESGEYGTVRELRYRAPVKASIGPSTTLMTETQKYHLQKNQLIVETSSNLHDIPYGDYFRVEAKWTVTSVAPNRCKLSVRVGCYFLKKTIFKGKIAKGTKTESKESFEMWTRLALDALPKGPAVDPQLLPSLVPQSTVVRAPVKRPRTRLLRRTNVYLICLAVLYLIMLVLLWRLSSRVGHLESIIERLVAQSAQQVSDPATPQQHDEHAVILHVDPLHEDL
eukprot:CAMPEP_0177654532 /NCGR_PEP_ID=MMETSP0447-20121125/14390_1 /TAXON_ID=0 /ORGANISM="Stygamoeba regulata, Strain BSH-02190019" /LENGTH=760 /DNA_ID=CAMNT_0019158203 /DNA_START=196 /DNA_END=2478 /DNA_ORIENTATION=+